MFPACAGNECLFSYLAVTLFAQGEKPKYDVYEPYRPCCTAIMNCRTGQGMECSEFFPDAMRYVSYRRILHGYGIRAYMHRIPDIVRENGICL